MTLLEPFFMVLTGGENLIGKKDMFLSRRGSMATSVSAPGLSCEGPDQPSFSRTQAAFRASAVSSYSRKIPEGNCHFFNFIFATV